MDSHCISPGREHGSSSSSHVYPSCDSSDSVSAFVPVQPCPLDVESQQFSGVASIASSCIRGWRKIFFGSYLNILLIFIPLSWMIDVSLKEPNDALVFTFCALTMVPLVKLHDLVTRDLAIRIGGSKTGLLNASMGNIVEMVFAVSALRKCKLSVVQSSLIGSILAKLLLVLGVCFFSGGLRFTEQGLDPGATHINSSLLSLSVGSVLLPAAYHFALSGPGAIDEISTETQNQSILNMSHAVSIVLLFIYLCYIFFQLGSHSYLFKETQPSNKLSYHLAARIKSSVAALKGRLHKSDKEVDHVSANSNNASETTLAPSYTCETISDKTSQSSSTCSLQSNFVKPEVLTVRLVRAPSMYRDASDDTCCSEPLSSISDVSRASFAEESACDASTQEPQLGWAMTLISLTALAFLVIITSDRLVESMDGLSSSISKEWIGFIVLPVVSSIAECITAANMSRRDQMTFSISVAIGASIQTALFVIPFMVTLAWCMGKPLALLFDPFQSIVLFFSVNILNFVTGGLKSNWLEGVMLCSLYMIIAISFWYYPDVAPSLFSCHH